MPAWLSEEWLAATNAVAGLAPAGLSATVQFAVSGLPGGDLRYYRVFAGGRAVGGALGAAFDADASFTTSADDARAMVRVELDPSVAFMRGQLKTAGNAAVVLALVGGWSSDGGLAVRRALAALSDL